MVDQYDQDKLFVTQDGHYGVVGYHHNKTVCYICPSFGRCAHVGFVEDNKGNINYPAIDIFYEMIETPKGIVSFILSYSIMNPDVIGTV